jgi:hypothetical protein
LILLRILSNSRYGKRLRYKKSTIRWGLSAEHFSVDGTLIQAWASMKSFRRKDGNDEPPGPGRNGTRDFHKEKRSNETHASTTDPDARLARKGAGKEAKLSFTGHLLMGRPGPWPKAA